MGGIVTAATISAGVFSVPYVFAGRAYPLTQIDGTSLSGVSHQDIPQIVDLYNDNFVANKIKISIRDESVERTASELGVSIDRGKAISAVSTQTITSWLKGFHSIQPQIVINAEKLGQQVEKDFSAVLTPPQNATLLLKNDSEFIIQASKSGEAVDLVSFERDIIDRVRTRNWSDVIALNIVTSEATVQPDEVEDARIFAQELIRNGATLSFEEQTWHIKPFTVKRLIRFHAMEDSQNEENYILGVNFDPLELKEYLNSTIAPEINRPAQNARFEISEDDKVGTRVEQFAIPERGLELNIEKSAQQIKNMLSKKITVIPLDVEITEADISKLADIESIGISDLISRGVSDFAGSPRNRIHNIKVGTARYHGLLINPGQEFSFNEFLGPVTKAAGYKPELVIKHDRTVPEYGGGLCQVSTTTFRAAALAGLKITDRRNHAYAVSYYGTPGFDATIYPPYTDFKFLNDTPSYILIQTKIEGTKLIFEFWGTDDGREVTVEGPSPYNRQADGAVSATLNQSVVKDGEIVLEDTFYSKYRSPKAYPKVNSAQDTFSLDAPSAPAATPKITPKPTNDATPTPTKEKPPTNATPNPSPAASSEEKT